MRRVYLGVLAVTLFVARPAFSQPSPEDAIRKTVQVYVAAFNAGDADAAAAAYAPDGTHTYVFGTTHRGRTEIAAGLKAFWAGPMKGTRIAITTLRVRPLAPTVAIEEEAFVLTGLASPDGGQMPPTQGLCLAVHQLQGEQWFAAAVQCLVPPPPAQTTK